MVSGTDTFGFFSKILTTPDNELRFDAKCWATLGVSVITTLVAAAGAFSVFPVPANFSAVYVAGGALGAGYAMNDVLNWDVST